MNARALIAGFIGFLSFALIAAQEPPAPAPDYPDPPDFLAERIADGRFELGYF